MLVFLDIDGTLVDVTGRPSKSTIHACRKARENGHKLFICTGRPKGEVGKNILDVGFDGVIAAGGALITVDSKLIFESEIPNDVVNALINYSHENGLGYSLESGDYFYTDSLQRKIFETLKRGFLGSKIDDTKYAKGWVTEKPLEGKVWQSGKVQKFMITSMKNLSVNVLKDKFGDVCEVFGGSMPFLGGMSAEITQKGVHKGSAITKVADYFGHPHENTLAIGDSYNDLFMIETAGIGIAMGNSEEEIKARADYITDKIGDNGLAHAFEHFGLI